MWEGAIPPTHRFNGEIEMLEVAAIILLSVLASSVIICGVWTAVHFRYITTMMKVNRFIRNNKSNLTLIAHDTNGTVLIDAGDGLVMSVMSRYIGFKEGDGERIVIKKIIDFGHAKVAANVYNLPSYEKGLNIMGLGLPHAVIRRLEAYPTEVYDTYCDVLSL